jgi:hypothetical protein
VGSDSQRARLPLIGTSPLRRQDRCSHWARGAATQHSPDGTTGTLRDTHQRPLRPLAYTTQDARPSTDVEHQDDSDALTWAPDHNSHGMRREPRHLARCRGGTLINPSGQITQCLSATQIFCCRSLVLPLDLRRLSHPSDKGDPRPLLTYSRYRSRGPLRGPKRPSGPPRAGPVLGRERPARLFRRGCVPMTRYQFPDGGPLTLTQRLSLTWYHT